jgi:hypothetical protein
MTSVLSPEAAALLERLRVGDNFSQPGSNYGAFAYSALAEAFLSNAIRLCDDDGMSDFRVYGALYSLRHGIELMLKCISRNETIDTILRVIARPALPFADACTALSLSKKEKGSLMRSLCVMRNVVEDRILHPQCHRQNIDEIYANKALEYFRQHPKTPRETFAVVWPLVRAGHDLTTLWASASPIIGSFASDARRHASEIGFETPLSQRELGALIELLASMDDGGDQFRYPSSISGEWYTDAPELSLSALRVFAQQVKSTCKVFESVREECYSLSTLRNPSPGYSGGT